jgi:chromosome segregation ATPase
MKTEKELRKEVDKILGDKVNAAIKAFQESRDKDFKELMTLNQALEDLEKKKAPFLEEKKGLNTMINKDLARWNFLDRHIPWLEKQIKGCKDQIEKITQKLTEVEVDSKTLNFFLNFKS